MLPRRENGVAAVQRQAAGVALRDVRNDRVGSCRAEDGAGIIRLFDLEWARPVSPFGASALWGPVAA
jgi:hypothetical protein